MATTLQDLLDGVRFETRDPDGISYQDEDIIYNINGAYQETFQQISNELEDYFVLPVLQDITALTREYALPEDFGRMIRAEIVIQDAWVPMTQYVRGISSNWNGGVNIGLTYIIPTYDFEGDNLVLEPTPQVTVTDGMRWTYSQVPELLVTGTDPIHANFKDMWARLVILRAAKSCFAQTEAVGGIVSVNVLDTRLAALEKQMIESIRLRTLSPRKKRRQGYFR